MELSDEEFREEFKPLEIPPAYFSDDTEENKIIFALNELGEATANEVIDKLEMLQPNIKNEQLVAITGQILASLYDKGLLKGTDKGGIMHYHLPEIAKANDRSVNPGSG